MAKRQQVAPKNFEEALGELEKIVHDIEQGEIGLEESLGKYERGIFVLQFCRNVLGEAEKQIELLSKGDDGAPRSELIDPPGDRNAAEK